MTWVKTDQTADQLPHILASHSLNPAALAAHQALYRTVMFGPSELSRAEREAIAVCVSAANDCHYWVVQHSAALTRESGRAELAEAVASGKHEELDERMRPLCGYATALTLRPWSIREADLAPLRAAGLSDREIVDANQVVAYFNYVNRVADGLGVELEPYWPDELRPPRTYPLRELAERALRWAVPKLRVGGAPVPGTIAYTAVGSAAGGPGATPLIVSLAAVGMLTIVAGALTRLRRRAPAGG